MLKEIQDRIYYLPHNESTGSPVLGLIIGDKFSLIVDSGNSPEHGKAFREEINKLSKIPVKYLVLTHHHFDHTSGLKQWEDLITIACKKTKEWLQSIDVAFQDELIINLGEITCILKEVPSSHTVDSTIIYIPERKVMFLGDSLYTTYSNGKFCYDKAKTLQMIEILKKYDTDYYVFSHSPLCDCNKNGMNQFLNKLRSIAELIGENYTVDDVVMKFTDKYKHGPNSDEMFVIKCFIN